MVYVDEEIDEDSFRCLDEESIQKIIPKAGPRAIFLKYWKLEVGCDAIIYLRAIFFFNLLLKSFMLYLSFNK